MKTLYLCGAGNSEGVRLALSIHREHPRWERMILLDDERQKHSRKILGVEVSGGFDQLAAANRADSEAVNLIARTAQRRRMAQERISGFGIPAASLIARGIDLEGAELGSNLIIYQNSVIGPETVICDDSVIFMGAIVGHESRLGRGCILAPNAVLNARVVLRDYVYVGTHATVLPEIEVGAGATIGAGSVVMENVPSGATVMGVPAQVIATAAIQAKSEAQKPETSRKNSLTAQEPLLPEAAAASESWLESTLAGIWKQALGLEYVGRADDFFRLGGNSLSALQITFRLRQLFQIEIPLQAIFDTPTVSGLANKLEPLVLGQADEALLSLLINEVQAQSSALVAI